METVNQENNQAEEQQERTFTQAELESVLADRMKRIREKYADYDQLKEKAGRLDQIEEASKTELQKAREKAAGLQKELDELRTAASRREMRDRIASELGVPASLLTADTEDGCKEQAQGILDFAKQSTSGTYPNVRDAGEVHGNINTTPKQSFATWANELFG